MNIEFRDFINNDYRSVMGLIQENWPPSELFKNETPLKTDLRPIIGIVGVSLETSEIIAFGHLILVKKMHGGSMGLIEDVVVDIKFRQQGIGKLLMCELENCARKQGAYKLILNTKESNLGFYKKLGFIGEDLSIKKILL